MEALTAGGPNAMAAVFIFTWWLERKDRQEGEAVRAQGTVLCGHRGAP
jgi:hypothetical protein